MSELKGTISEGQTLKGRASASPYIPERMAHKLTFTGAVEAEYDGSANVSVEIPKGGGSVTPEDVASAVEAYMAEHPVEESDPTVPAWAKAETKPSYTAEEVGALPADTEIPAKPEDIGAQPAGNYATKDEIPTTLPNPHKLTFSGAVEAEYDGSEAVEVVIPQGGGGASEEVWEYGGAIPVDMETEFYSFARVAEYKKVCVIMARNYNNALSGSWWFQLRDSKGMARTSCVRVNEPVKYSWNAIFYEVGNDKRLQFGFWSSNNKQLFQSFKTSAPGFVDAQDGISTVDIDIENDYYDIGHGSGEISTRVDGSEDWHWWGVRR